MKNKSHMQDRTMADIIRTKSQQQKKRMRSLHLKHKRDTDSYIGEIRKDIRTPAIIGVWIISHSPRVAGIRR